MSNSESVLSRLQIADAIDAYDAEISVLQSGKLCTFVSYREALKGQGVAADAVRAEVAALKAAIRQRRALANPSPGAEEREALADEILLEITASSRVAHGARDQSSGSRQSDQPRTEAVRSSGEGGAGEPTALVLDTGAGEAADEEIGIPAFLTRLPSAGAS
ncbi:hypothetical protein ACJ4V0_15895 [Phreatobacter sp. HK31-P]